MTHSTQTILDKLKALNITLPEVATPAAAYLPFVQTGKLVFLSGHIAKKDGKAWVGQLGKNMTPEEGKAAARAIAIDLMGTLQAAAGELGNVKRIVKLMSLVNSTGDFTEQHLVTNGASELFGEVFGDAGKHARSAFGVAQIPMGAGLSQKPILTSNWRAVAPSIAIKVIAARACNTWASSLFH
jgi:enamine deaminase RidA (YjgF/YER057c/UK114 family)